MLGVIVDFALYNLVPSLLAGLWAMAVIGLVVRIFGVDSARLRGNMLLVPLIKSTLVLLGVTTAMPFVAGAFWADVLSNALPFKWVAPLFVVWVGLAYLGLWAMRSYMAKRIISNSLPAAPDSRVAASLERMLELFRTQSILDQCKTECRWMAHMPRPDLYITQAGASPAIVAGNPPTLVVPQRLVAELDAEELDSVLAHELAHVSIEVPYILCDMTLRRAFTLSSPTGYVINRIVARDEELVCDEIAAQVTGQPEALASALVKAHRVRTQTRHMVPAVVATLLGNERPLKNRVQRLLGANYGELDLRTAVIVKMLAAWVAICVLVFVS